MVEPMRLPPNQRDDHLKSARQLIENWRQQTWKGRYSTRPFGPHGLISDTAITAIATRARLHTITDLINAGWGASHARKHGDELLALLKTFYEEFLGCREREKRERMEAKKQETVAKNEAKKQAAKDERHRQKLIRQSQPKVTRPSRAKKFKTSPDCLPDTAQPSMLISATGSENIAPWAAYSPFRHPSSLSSQVPLYTSSSTQPVHMHHSHSLINSYNLPPVLPVASSSALNTSVNAAPAAYPNYPRPTISIVQDLYGRPLVPVDYYGRPIVYQY